MNVDKNLKILYVDDSELIRDMVGEALYEIGYLYTTSAEDGLEALQIIDEAEFEFDFIITDINMPNMNGFELIANLRNKLDYMETPILVLTTEKSQQMKDKGYQVGATSWMVKPFDKELLNDSIIKTLKKVQAI
jgi:two-component system chemotaxis response regulator CheY